MTSWKSPIVLRALLCEPRLLSVLLLLAVGCKQGSSTASTDQATLLAQLKLTGVGETDASRWALLLVAEPGKPTEHLKLTVGQRQGAIEVLAIDARARTVSVRVGNHEATLSPVTHAPKPEDGYAWLQRLTPDEHARLHRATERGHFVDAHTQAHEERQRREQARQVPENDHDP